MGLNTFGTTPLAFNVGANEIMRLVSNGNVGIGTVSPDQKLTVNGTIHSTEVKVTASVPIPDYVFKPAYGLPKLTEVKSYIDANHHLPEIPSATEMEANGISLGEMNTRLLKKVEELTLYLIEEHDKNAKQKARIAALEKALSKLTTNK